MFKRILMTFAISLFFLISIQPVFAMDPTDISNHWAQDYILNLLNNDIMETYSDGTFKPDNPVTRGEFATALARQMQMLPENKIYFQDLQGYQGYKMISALVKDDIINGYPDGTFRPEQPLTKAEVIAIMSKALGLTDDKVMINLDIQPFRDIPTNHWARNQIKIAAKIGLASGDQVGNFYPKKEVSRAEAAKYLTRMENLSTGTGYLTDVYPTSGKVSVNLLDGKRVILNFDEETIIGRNNRLVKIDDILKTDKVYMITDNNQEIKYLKAYGMVTQDDLATEISTMTSGILEPTDVKTLADGNLNILKPKVQDAVQKQLLSQGLTDNEVTAIMTTNWNKLENLSKVRLAEAVAIETGLPLDITKGILNGDWEKIKNYAQIEVIQRLVQEVLNYDLIS